MYRHVRQLLLAFSAECNKVVEKVSGHDAQAFHEKPPQTMCYAQVPIDRPTSAERQQNITPWWRVFSCRLVFHSICGSHINSVALDLSTQYHGLSLKIFTFPSLE